MNPRKAYLEVEYNNRNITEDLRPHLLGWTYTDNLSGQADDLQINLEDVQKLWSGPWLPEQGATIKATIKRENWEQDGKVDTLPLGQFEIDELDINYPPSTVSMKAQSVPESKSIRGEFKSRAWEKTRLSVIARDKANENGMKLFYDTQDDPEYDRVEQTGETDLSFLMRLCNDAGLCLKVTGTQIAIFDEQKYERQEPVDTIQRGVSRIKDYNARMTLTGIYRSCRVEYHDPTTKQVIRYTFTPPKPPKTGRVLVVNERVTSIKEAERLAKKRLRQENKNAVTVSLTLPGDTRFVAGQTLNLSGFGAFDGKYIITQAVHAKQNGYETRLQLRKTLEGY